MTAGGPSWRKKDLSHSEVSDLVTGELKKAFKPEFLNRLDEIIVFEKLSTDDIKKILQLNLDKLAKKVKNQGLDFKITKEAQEFLAARGFSPLNGARPLRRLLEAEVENRIAQEIIVKGKNKETGLVNGKILNVELIKEPNQQIKVTIE